MPSGFGELGGGEVVVGALVAPGGDGSSCVGISGSEVFTVRSALGHVFVSGALEPDALACNISEERERVGDAQSPCAALVVRFNRLAGFFGLVKTLTECLNVHAFPHFPA